MRDVKTPSNGLQLWFTAREIADLAAAGVMAGMPETKRGVNGVVEREGWNKSGRLCRIRPGCKGGGGYEYHLELLPAQARMSYLLARVPSPVFPAGAARECEVARNQTERMRDIAMAKVWLVEEADRVRGVLMLCVSQADGWFVEMVNTGQYPVPAWVQKTVDKFSSRSLARWRKRAGKQGYAVLGHDVASSRKEKGLLETANGGAVKGTILAWLAKGSGLSAHHIRGFIEEQYGSELVDLHGALRPLPPLRTFQHFIKRLRQEEKVVLTKITDPDKYRSHFRLSGTGAYSTITTPNELWQIDASPVDALCVDGRHSMYGSIDIATRRMVITLSKTPKSAAVGLHLRKAFLKYGVPDVIKMDNGADFMAHATRHFLSKDLGVVIDTSTAYSPEQKGHIERAIRTFQHDVCPQLPGYIGHNVAERKAIEGRKSFAARMGKSKEELFEVKLTAVELQRRIDDWLEYVYHERGHGGLKGKTPNEVAAQAVASGAVVRKVEMRALDVLLMPWAEGGNGHRRMTKRGIRVDGAYYLTGKVLPGTQVMVRLDPLDMGKIYVFAADGGRFLDVAVCPQLAAIDREGFVRARKEEFNQMVGAREQAIKRDVRKLQKGASGIERTVALAKRKREKQRDERAADLGNVVAMPREDGRPVEEHVTANIHSALQAANFERRVVDMNPSPLPEEAAAIHEALNRGEDAAVVMAAMHEREAADNIVSIDPDRDLLPEVRLFKWAMRMEERLGRGEAILEEENARLRGFQETAEYQTMRSLMEAFGLKDTLDVYNRSKKTAGSYF